MVSCCDDYTAESFFEGSGIILKCIEIIVGNETITCRKNSESPHGVGNSHEIKTILLNTLM